MNLKRFVKFSTWPSSSVPVQNEGFLWNSILFICDSDKMISRFNYKIISCSGTNLSTCQESTSEQQEHQKKISNPLSALFWSSWCLFCSNRYTWNLLFWSPLAFSDIWRSFDKRPILWICWSESSCCEILCCSPTLVWSPFFYPPNCCQLPG